MSTEELKKKLIEIKPIEWESKEGLKNSASIEIESIKSMEWKPKEEVKNNTSKDLEPIWDKEEVIEWKPREIAWTPKNLFTIDPNKFASVVYTDGANNTIWAADVANTKQSSNETNAKKLSSNEILDIVETKFGDWFNDSDIENLDSDTVDIFCRAFYNIIDSCRE